MKRILVGIAVVTLALWHVACQPSVPREVSTSRDAIRTALNAAWRAHLVESPDAQASSPVGTARAATAASIARFKEDARAAIMSLDSALAAIPSTRGAEHRYLTETLAGLVSTLKDRINAQVAMLEAIQDEERGMHVEEETGMRMLTAQSVAHEIEERTILRLAAWERRFLRESHLADSYQGRLLAQVENTRASGTPDSVLLQRREIEGRILSTMRRVLSKKERMEHRVTIIHRHGRCYWTSRENRELVRSVSGAFQYFTPTNGGGYLKMLDTHSLPDSVRSWGPRFRYMDHLSIMLGTITCSGTSGKCAPDGAE